MTTQERNNAAQCLRVIEERWRGMKMHECPSLSYPIPGLYPPAMVREAFADLLRELGMTQWSIAEGGNRRVSYSLNWHDGIRRWGILQYDRDVGSQWFAFPTCNEAGKPN